MKNKEARAFFEKLRRAGITVDVHEGDKRQKLALSRKVREWAVYEYDFGDGDSGGWLWFGLAAGHEDFFLEHNREAAMDRLAHEIKYIAETGCGMRATLVCDSSKLGWFMIDQ